MQADIRLLKNAARPHAPTENDPHVDDRSEAEEVEVGQRQRAHRSDLDNATLHIVCFTSFLDLSVFAI